MKNAEVVAGELVETKEDAAVVFELSEETLDEVAFFIALSVVVTGVEPIGPRRDDRFSPQLTDGNANMLGVVAFVRQEKFGAVACE